MRRTGLLPRVLAPLAVSAVVVVALAGCVPAPAATASAAPTSSAGAAPTIAKIDLNGTAADNQAYFDLVNQKLIAAGGDLSGRPFIDNLVKAGYPKVNMEVTPDRTSVNLAADNIEFSIRFGQSCLIGQYGNTGYSSTVQKMLSTSRCLVGTTRTIDW
jgi:hypothetical protein